MEFFFKKLTGKNRTLISRHSMDIDAVTSRHSMDIDDEQHRKIHRLPMDIDNEQHRKIHRHSMDIDVGTNNDRMIPQNPVSNSVLPPSYRCEAIPVPLRDVFYYIKLLALSSRFAHFCPVGEAKLTATCQHRSFPSGTNRLIKD